MYFSVGLGTLVIFFIIVACCFCTDENAGTYHIYRYRKDIEDGTADSMTFGHCDGIDHETSCHHHHHQSSHVVGGQNSSYGHDAGGATADIYHATTDYMGACDSFAMACDFVL